MVGVAHDTTMEEELQRLEDAVSSNITTTEEEKKEGA